MSLNVSLIILDPLYSTHDQDENDTRAMAALALQRPPRPSVVRSGHPRLSWGGGLELVEKGCRGPHSPARETGGTKLGDSRLCAILVFGRFHKMPIHKLVQLGVR